MIKNTSCLGKAPLGQLLPPVGVIRPDLFEAWQQWDESGEQALDTSTIVHMGLGFLPDGRLLIVSMHDGLLLRREHDGRLVAHADLSHLSPYPWSGMVVDGRGNAYLGNLGFTFPGGEFAPESWF
jgi:hypothetical protein